MRHKVSSITNAQLQASGSIGLYLWDYSIKLRGLKQSRGGDRPEPLLLSAPTASTKPTSILCNLPVVIGFYFIFCGSYNDIRPATIRLIVFRSSRSRVKEILNAVNKISVDMEHDFVCFRSPQGYLSSPKMH